MAGTAADHIVCAVGGLTEWELTFAFRRVLGRKPREADLTLLRRAFEKQRAIYASDEKAAAQLIKVGAAPVSENLAKADYAALSAVCLALFNTDEALTRE